MNVLNLDKFKKSYEEQLKKYQTSGKECENIIIVGPTLIKQYLDESKNTVNKRLEHINDDINLCEKSLDDVTKRLTTSREAVHSAVKELQALIAKGS